MYISRNRKLVAFYNLSHTDSLIRDQKLLTKSKIITIKNNIVQVVIHKLLTQKIQLYRVSYKLANNLKLVLSK